MSIDLAELERLAKAANCWGRWAIWPDLKEGGFVHVGNADGVIPDGETATREDAEPNPIAKCYTPEIAEFIAALDPDTVLALVERVREAEARIERIKQARANHPVCELYEGDDAVSCGWKSVVLDIDKALEEA